MLETVRKVKPDFFRKFCYFLYEKYLLTSSLKYDRSLQKSGSVLPSFGSWYTPSHTASSHAPGNLFLWCNLKFIIRFFVSIYDLFLLAMFWKINNHEIFHLYIPNISQPILHACSILFNVIPQIQNIQSQYCIYITCCGDSPRYFV